MSTRSFLFCLGIFIGVQLMALQSAAYNTDAYTYSERVSSQEKEPKKSEKAAKVACSTIDSDTSL